MLSENEAVALNEYQLGQASAQQKRRRALILEPVRRAQCIQTMG